jgi:hypothetical protein
MVKSPESTPVVSGKKLTVYVQELRVGGWVSALSVIVATGVGAYQALMTPLMLAL